MATISDIKVTRNGNLFTLSNSKIEFNLELVGSKLFSRSLENKQTGYKWENHEDLLPTCYVPGFIYNGASVEFTAKEGVNEDGSNLVKATWTTKSQLATLYYTLTIYENLPAINAEMRLDGKVECNGENNFQDVLSEGVLDLNDKRKKLIFEYVPTNASMIAVGTKDKHLKLTDVSFFDGTDVHDNFIATHEREIFSTWVRNFPGQIFTLEAYLQGEALLLVKESPTKIAQCGDCENDFYYNKNGSVAIMGCGLSFKEPFEVSCETPLYGATVIVGDKNSVLKDFRDYYLRGMSYVERKPRIVSNTWGDANCDGALNEPFLLKEAEMAKYLGVDVMQIDDGWQQGHTMGSVYSNNGAQIGEGMYDQRPDFWNVRKEILPNGLKPIIEKAKENGTEIGLWYACDATGDYKFYKTDIENLIRLRHEHGVSTFKLDGMRILNKARETNVVKILDAFRKESNNTVRLNMDTTAGKRFGYLYHRQYGNIFVENRYTRSRTYYPHATLRNLWDLSKYIPSIRLQMECLNLRRNTEYYPENDLLAPNTYGMDFAFAVTMFASPLLWFEMQNLTDEDKVVLKKIMDVYKGVREDIANAYIMPIGNRPDGANFTGFNAELNGYGYLLLFRGLTKEDSYTFNNLSLQDSNNLEIIYKSCDANAEINGNSVTFTAKSPRSFALIKYSK